MSIQVLILMAPIVVVAVYLVRELVLKPRRHDRALKVRHDAFVAELEAAKARAKAHNERSQG